MRYKWYVLGLLLALAVVNYIDRLSVYVLQIQIKKELLLSDAQLGLLTGVAFSIVYTIFSIPLARLADRKSRKYIIAAALAAWSVLTILCGFAAGFISLIILRMGVAIGEGGSLPASHALIANYFRRDQRATALAVWSLSFPLGQMLAFGLGGWLGEALGWRKVFIVLGVSGVLLSPLVLLTLKEPKRGATDAWVPSDKPLPFWESVRILWRFKSMRHAIFGGALCTYVALVVLNWSAPFYNRVYGASLHELGTYLAVMTGAGSSLGMIMGGVTADRLGHADVRWRMLVPMIGALGFVPLLFAQFLVVDLYLSLALGVLTLLLAHAFYAPTVACVQTLAPANLRAFASAIMVTTFTIFGMSLGPLGTGLISDYLITKHGMATESLRYAIVSCAVFALWAAYHYFRASQLLPGDVELLRGSDMPLSSVVSGTPAEVRVPGKV